MLMHPLESVPTFKKSHCVATTVFVAVLSASIASVSLGGSVAAPYEVGTWRGFRSAAVSYTFDDNTPNQYSVAVPMFNAMGFRLTLFTVTTWLPGGSWAPIQNAASFGHEIASHTVSHPDVSGLSDAQQTVEVQNSHDAINANITGQDCVTLAYPYCVPGKRSIISQYYIAARTCSGQLVPSTPSDFLSISSFICGSLGTVKTAQDFNTKADSAAAANAWCVYLIHAIDGDSGYSPLSSTTLHAGLNYLAANPDTFWVDTFGNVVRYIKERNDVSVMETASGADSITLAVTDTLDDSIYDFPVSLRRPLPMNWAAAAATQDGAPVDAQIVNVGGTDYVMFYVVPDGGEVVLSRVYRQSVIRSPLQASSTGFTFRLEGEAGESYTTYLSADLADWPPMQTNALVTTSTTITVATSNTANYYRAQRVP